MQTKSFLASKTIWGIVLAIAPQLIELGASGVLGPKVQAAISGLGALLAIYGRATANKPINFVPPPSVPLVMSAIGAIYCGAAFGTMTGCTSPTSGDGAAPTIVFTPADADLAGQAAALLYIKTADKDKRPARIAKLERVAGDIEKALTERSELTKELLESWTARLVQEGQLEAEDAAFLVPLIERVWARFRPDLAPLPTLDPAVKANVLAFTGGIKAHIALTRELSAGTS